MTVIVGLSNERRAWLGCDSQMTRDDSEKADFGRPKWEQHHGVYVAFCGSAAASGPILAGLQDEVSPEGCFSARQLAHAVREAARGQGWTSKVDDGGPAYLDLSFLITDGRQIVHVDPRGALFVIPEGNLVALGSGREFARGADFVAKRGIPGGGYTSSGRVRLAVESAIEACLYCGGEAIVQMVEPSACVMGVR